MAELLKTILGSASGKVGDLVFKRHKNGKVFFSTHKGYNTISESPNCIKNRANFNKAVKFSKAVNSLPEIRKIWNSSSVKGRSAYTKIMSFNIKLLKDARPSLLNHISPGGFGFLTKNLRLTENSLSIDIKLGDSSEDLLNLPFTSNFVVALFDQKQDAGEEVYPFVVAEAEFIPESTSEFKNITAYFDSTQNQILELFEKAIVFMVLTKTDVKPLLSSSTLASKTDIVKK